MKNKSLTIFTNLSRFKRQLSVSLVLAAPGGTIWLISIVPSLSITFVVFSAQLSPFLTANEGPITVSTAICVLLHESPLQHHRPHHSLALSNFDHFSRSNLQLKQAHISGCSRSGSIHLSIPSRAM